MSFEVEWDQEKAESNLRKHGVSFEEASTVLGDPLSLTLDDPDHSEHEPRFLLLGSSAAGRFLIVSIAEETQRQKRMQKENEKEKEKEMVHIISARLMTPRERRAYEEEAQR